MLETIDLDARIDKEAYKSTMEALDLRLAELQREMQLAGRPVVIVFEGWDAAGKGSVLSRLLQPLDPRGFEVHNIKAATDAQRLWAPMRRFWQLQPRRRRIALFNHSWYLELIEEAADLIADDGNTNRLDEGFQRIRVFERQLADDGTVIVKFFLHIGKKEQARRFKKLAGDPAYAWKIGKEERRRHKRYKAYHAAYEEILRETSTPHAPWNLIPATQERFACLRVVETLIHVFEQALATVPEPEIPFVPSPRRTSPLDRADLGLALAPEEYKPRLETLQRELRRLHHLCYVRRMPVAIVYEGWDAAGKGGNIRRVTRELDPRGYDVAPIAAPEGGEKYRHYLWRFWRVLPKAGHFTIFDRSWYGRVLVERVEGFAKNREWRRAYREINEFEAQLAEFGMVVVKFWLHISSEEQLRRFDLRQQLPHKAWKITQEDWRNRERWDDYWIAVSDMIEQTSTAHAPWTIVEANDKRWARVRTLTELVERLRARLD